MNSVWARSAMWVLAIVFMGGVGGFAQKNEHYSSPLYSPRKYDPGQVAGTGLPEPLKKVAIEQRLGGQLPLNAKFKDEDGRTVELGEYFKSGMPVILALVYFECPMLCNEVLNGLTGSLKGMSFEPGREFDIVAISFDTRENTQADLAKNKRAGYLERYGSRGSGEAWHFLTGEQKDIDAVTEAVGFHYYWDDKTEQFAHAGAIMIVTPDGRLSRYFYGVDFPPKDVKFGIMESTQNKIGTAAEQLLLYCYHYDPASGKYGLAILRVMRLAAIATLIGLGAMVFVFWRKNRQKHER